MSIIKLYTFITFAVCTEANTEVNAEGDTCVCAEDFYQTNTADVGEAPQCTACPLGSTTGGSTNSQDISACGKNGRRNISIHWH